MLRTMELWEQEVVREWKKEECISKDVHRVVGVWVLGGGWVVGTQFWKCIDSKTAIPIYVGRYIALILNVSTVSFSFFFFSFQLRFCPQWQKGWTSLKS